MNAAQRRNGGRILWPASALLLLAFPWQSAWAAEVSGSLLLELGAIFVGVITPVYTLVAVGYLFGRRLGLQAQTLSRYAYYILVPAFVFKVMSTADMEARLAAQMVGYILVVHVTVALAAFLLARALKRPAQMVGAYVVIAVFGNVGNFGLPLIEFRLGPEALIPATVYFLAVIVIAFVISVAAASWHRGGGLHAMLSVIRTPALVALVPALAFNLTDVTPPLWLGRSTDLLGSAMVPTMLVTLGVQLSAAQRIRLEPDVFLATGVRLLGAPVLAMLLAAPFALTETVRAAGILQASMPTAVLAVLIALEHKLLADFVTTAVLFSTLASVVTLTLLMAVI
ncbi:MAG: AEC family transporter [Candidatus Competibacterales bacterium]|nr:AEC family transporter [Candidatus Competibacterales bacterium]